MLQGFRDFIMRGNVIELAVAFVMGTAFTAIVTAFVEAVVNPLIGLFFQADTLADALQWQVSGLFGTTSTFAFGAVIAAIINFLAVALVVYFALVLPMNKMAERRKAKLGIEDEEVPPTAEELLLEIRDLLARQNPAS